MAAVTNVEEYLARHEKWRGELNQLREIMLSFNLEETIKWGCPVYCLDGKNLFGIAGFKNHFAIWFFQGAIVEDPDNVLVNAQENKTKSLRQMRFTSGNEINQEIIVKYLQQSISIFQNGTEVKPSKKKELLIPEDLDVSLDDNPELKYAFYKLTPGKQRDYADYISSAKREETRHKRIEKIIPMIIEGKGLNDKYNKK